MKPFILAVFGVLALGIIISTVKKSRSELSPAHKRIADINETTKPAIPELYNEQRLAGIIKRIEAIDEELNQLQRWSPIHGDDFRRSENHHLDLIKSRAALVKSLGDRKSYLARTKPSDQTGSNL